MSYRDVLLINPPLGITSDIYEHIGLGYIAACLRKRNINVEIINIPEQGWTVSRAVKEVKNIPCRVIGVSIPFQESAKRAFNFITGLKKAGVDAHISIGGIFPTYAYEEIINMFPAVDSVVLGEGEETFAELAEKIISGHDWHDIKGLAYLENNTIIRNDFRPLIEDLDSIPFPARDTLPESLKRVNAATMTTSRGCYGRCSFCSVTPFFSSFGPKYRVRSSQNVMDELDILYHEYDVRNIAFNDAIFIGGKGSGYNRAREIAEEILKRNMDLHFYIHCRPNDVDEELFGLLREAGLRKVFLGVESGSQTMLDRFQKDITVEENLRALETLSKFDIFVALGMITFDDRITFTELNENLMFLQQAKKIMPKNRLNFNVLGKLLPLAGTEVERYMKETRRYRGNSIKYTYSIDDRKINLLYNTANTLANIFWKVKRALNMTIDYDRVWMKS